MYIPFPFLKQMEDDWDGFGSYRIALFGAPGTGKFEFEMTGRHLQVRANGDAADSVAFGGGIVYGHGLGSPRTNLFYYQTKKANEVFKALEGKQREKALLQNPPQESKVPLQGKGGTFPGLAVSELSADQTELVASVLKIGLAPYREKDVEESMKVLKAGGGLDSLHMAFYKKGDLGADEIWDIWRVEGPSFVWHFRGAPHVHTYINIGLKKA